MNREVMLIQAAIKDLRDGDDPDLDDEFRTRCYLGAIAKTLLAQHLSQYDMPDYPEHHLDQHVHCRICHETLLECVCGPPPATPWVDWGEDEHTAPDGGPSL
jgi:hypothetical protein